MERIEQILWDKTTDDLTRLCKISGIKGKSGCIKEEKIKALCELFSNI